MLNRLFCGFLVLLGTVGHALGAYELLVKTTAPAILGAQINFTAELHEDGRIAPSSQYRFKWWDTASPQHAKNFDTSDPYSEFFLIYDEARYAARTYEMHVEVGRVIVGFYKMKAQRTISFNVEENLSGNMSLIQNGSTRISDYVSLHTPVNHSIALVPADAEFIKNATNVTTYWFCNCAYLGASPGLSRLNSYESENQTYDVEALVIVSFDKIEPITTTPNTPTTSTTIPTTSTAASSSMPGVPAGGEAGNMSTTTPTTNLPKKQRREALNDSTSATGADKQPTSKPKPVEKEISVSGEEIEVKQMANSTAKELSPETTTAVSIDDDFRNHSGACRNISEIYRDPKKTYGYFRRRFMAKAPVGNMTVSGNSWLQHGELLTLNIKCTGSKPMAYCIKIFEGPYNTTGNETCVELLSLESCEFPFVHLFQLATPKTVAIIVENKINKIVYQVAVNFYKATEQSQLSVIVVPVSFSLVAVILVVFGIAYYIQNRNRYIIEVADFNFGDSQSVDMEYKTFQARLLDSIREAIPWPKRNVDTDARETHSGDDSSIKYGSMT